MGLSFKGGVLYGVTGQGDILTINTSTGSGTSIGGSTASFWGLATSGSSPDTQPPTVNWISPVANEQVYEAACGATVGLEVSASDTCSGVNRVEFKRWDAVNNVWVDIGVDNSSPYRANLDVCTLNMEWNQVNADAFDNAENWATKYIWIYRTAPTNCTTSASTWQNFSISSQTGTFTASFDSIPNTANMDGVTGLSASPASAYTNLATGACISWGEQSKGTTHQSAH
ncbi:MAG: hypothetical protein HYR94_02760 [Chloroflexi bacterium]|nr:hypothetical protein [Chloroflexota bacterium]